MSLSEKISMFIEYFLPNLEGKAQDFKYYEVYCNWVGDAKD
jgi:hypothetical protein